MGRLVRRIIVLFISKNVHEITEVPSNLAIHSYVECLEYVIGIAIGAEFLMNIYNTGCSCTDTPDLTWNCLSELLLKSSSKRQKTDVLLGICSLSVTFFLPPSRRLRQLYPTVYCVRLEGRTDPGYSLS